MLIFSAFVDRDRIVVGNKTKAVHVTLNNPTPEMLAACEIKSEAKLSDLSQTTSKIIQEGHIEPVATIV